MHGSTANALATHRAGLASEALHLAGQAGVFQEPVVLWIAVTL
jgi:hypothetical protein